MGGQPCRLKIIMNGSTIQSETHLLCYQIQKDGVEVPDDIGYKIVDLFNSAENAVFQAKRLFLESQGYNGPWPNSLKNSTEVDKYQRTGE